MKQNIFKYIPAAMLAISLASCNDFLDIEPPSNAVPEDYYQAEDQVQAATNQFYQDVLPYHSNWSYGLFGVDNGTDNQTSASGQTKYGTGLWLTPSTDNYWSWEEKGEINWEDIRGINYTLNTVLAYNNAGGISGSQDNIRHYIGELYFFRAFCYYDMLKRYGDLPIIKEALSDNEQLLIENSKRSPRTEVARFILEDLKTAIDYMNVDIDGNRNRVSADAARLFRSRVALFEGCWLNYFKGTAFVPLGDGWPGAAKDYNAGYAFQSGSIDGEIEYFLTEAAADAKAIADKYMGQLRINTGLVPQSLDDPENPYFAMFGSDKLSGVPEVLLWREYSLSEGLVHNVEVMVEHGNSGVGLTRGMVESFLMKDGLPIYAQHDGFEYDDTTIAAVRANADPRLKIFLKEPGQVNCFKNMDYEKGTHMVEIEPYPEVLQTNAEVGYGTGYALRKGGNFDRMHCANGNGYVASINFRATEAFLNYMEAQYMLNHNLAEIKPYWEAVRTAAGFTGTAIDPEVTIAATDMSKETLDWGAYSAGQLLDDAVLYNIRRERRSELMAEALRMDDLLRWRALDQLVGNYYHMEGIHIWNTPMEGWYVDSEGKSTLVADGSESANMSQESRSEYFLPLEKNQTSNNAYREGYTWHMAHYLSPVPYRQFLLTSSDYTNPENSTLYQNPYWPLEPDQAAER